VPKRPISERENTTDSGGDFGGSCKEPASNRGLEPEVQRHPEPPAPSFRGDSRPLEKGEECHLKCGRTATKRFSYV